MSLISQRPRHWTGVVGQDRPVRVLKAALQTAKFMPRGFMFEGVQGIGKTTLALILSRVLMCTGEDPFGCGKCPSCLAAIESTELTTHPDFKMCVAAQCKVQEMLDEMELPPVIGKRRVVLVDAAHHLSRDAWDLFLAPLEKNDTNCVYVFVTTEPEHIPSNIRSRCCAVRCTRLTLDMVRGLLVNRANTNNIPYEQGAIDLIAHHSKGLPREALLTLNTIAAIGSVTTTLATDVIDTSLEEGCLNLLLSIAVKSDIKDALVEMDKLTLAFSPSQILECLFTLFGKVKYGEDPIDPLEKSAYDTVRAGYPDQGAVTSILFKWTSANNLPADAMTLFVHEFAQQRDKPTRISTTTRFLEVAPATKESAPLSADDISKMLSAEKVKD
jgi:DNA polymerase-3 subunit gamma/tau